MQQKKKLALSTQIFIALVIFCVEATEAILARISFSDAIFL